MNMPPITDEKPKVTPKASRVVEPAAEPEAPKFRVKLLELKLPIGELPGYVKNRVDVVKMSKLQREALAQLTTGLQHEGVKLKDGSNIKGVSHTVKWLLENIANESFK